MVTATSLQEQMAHKVSELKDAVAGISDESAAVRPSPDSWCAKEILSHLCGDEGEGFTYGLQRFLDEDTPLIGVVAGLPYYTPRRQQMSVGDLIDQVEAQYGRMALFLGALNDAQLSRKARIPLLKDSPLGEEVTLGQWAGAIINFHLVDHVNQLRNLPR